MKKVLFALSVLLISCSCININVGNGKNIRCKGPVVEKTMEGLVDFNAIVANGNADIEFSQADAFSVVVKANEEVFEYLDYRVEDGVLIIGTKKNVNLLAEEYEVYITLPVLESFTVNGASDVEQKGPYVADQDLKICINGSGELEIGQMSVPSLRFTLNGASDLKAIGLEVDELVVSVNGAGDATLSGKAGNVQFSVNGAADIDARGLEYDNISTHKAGAASIRLSK